MVGCPIYQDRLIVNRIYEDVSGSDIGMIHVPCVSALQSTQCRVELYDAHVSMSLRSRWYGKDSRGA